MNSSEIQIRFSDVMAAFLKSLLLVFCVMILSCALCASFGAYKAKHVSIDPTLNEKIATLKKNIGDKKDLVSRLEKESNTFENISIPYTEKKVERDMSLNSTRREYLENSLFYDIDPFNCGTSRVTFAVDTALPEVASEDFAKTRSDALRRISAACTMMTPFSDETMETIRYLMNTTADKKYVEELISIESKDDQFVEICVYNKDPEIAKKVADYIYQKIIYELSLIDPNCTTTVISSFTGYEVNWEMNTTHVSFEDSLLLAEKQLATDQDSIAKMYTTIDENNKKIEDTNTEIKTLENSLASNQKKLNNVIASSSVKKSMIKYGIIGLILGFVLACALIYVRYVLGGKVRNRSDLLTRYPYPLLGVLPSRKKHLFNRWIKRLEGDSLYPDKDVISSAAANILAVTSSEEGKICMVGPIDEKDPNFSEMAKALKGKIEYKGNILLGTEGIRNIDGYDKVILVEKRNSSRYDAINEEVSRIRTLRKDVLGMVLL